LKSSADDIGALLMWLSGYYANEDDETTVDFAKMKEDGIKIANYCKAHPTMGLLDASEKALGRSN
ncbi:MAG: HdeA/HdeB family chaperone, partial [Hyphomicrobiales bacterium]